MAVTARRSSASSLTARARAAVHAGDQLDLTRVQLSFDASRDRAESRENRRRTFSSIRCASSAGLDFPPPTEGTGLQQARLVTSAISKLLTLLSDRERSIGDQNARGSGARFDVDFVEESGGDGSEIADGPVARGRRCRRVDLRSGRNHGT